MFYLSKDIFVITGITISHAAAHNTTAVWLWTLCEIFHLKSWFEEAREEASQVMAMIMTGSVLGLYDSLFTKPYGS